MSKQTASTIVTQNTSNGSGSNGNGSIFSANRSYPFHSIREEEYIANKKNLLQLWYKDPHRIDLGECLLSGVVEYIPRSIHPNVLTTFSLCCNTILFLCASMVPWITDNKDYNSLSSSSSSSSSLLSSLSSILFLKALLCLICGGLIGAAMALDALDGMHARATQQTSHVGALLDRWFDSLGSIMSAASAVIGLDCNIWIIDFAISGPLVVYNAQLLIHHHQHAFPRLSGVEGQLLVMFAFIVSAVLNAFNLGWLCAYFGAIFGSLSTLGCIFYIIRFGQRFSVIMWVQFGICIMTVATACILHQWGYLCTFEFMVLSIVTSNRFNGDLALHTEANLPLEVPEYLLLIGCVCTYLENIFARTFVVNIMSLFVNALFGNAFVSLDTLQKIHPTIWIFIILCFGKGLTQFLRVLKIIRVIDQNKKKPKQN